VLIDVTAPREKVAEEIWQIVENRMKPSAERGVVL
jgi:hypothetical protein